MDIRSPAPGRSFAHSSFQHWVAGSEPDRVQLDLGGASFVDTLGMALVIAAAERASLDGVPVEFTPPASADPARYLSRMHLGTALAELDIESGLNAVAERDTGSRLAELHRFDPTGTDALAEAVHGAMVSDGGPAEDANDFFKAISEVLSNVVDHSGVHGGWAAMQAMPTPTQPEITFAVADVGFGLRRSLQQRHEVDSDQHAIELAFTRGVSGASGDGRGMGLDDLKGRISRRQGIIRIWSGDTIGVLRPAGPIRYVKPGTAFPGTIIYAAFGTEKG